MTRTKHDEIPYLPSNSQLHLYLAGGCPFCHRVLATLVLTGLDERVGFAKSQEHYEKEVLQLFQSLARLEIRLASNLYLLGNTLTESDLYLLATLVRFDNVYCPLFKCSYRRIGDYPALGQYLGRLRDRRYRRNVQSTADQGTLLFEHHARKW